MVFFNVEGTVNSTSKRLKSFVKLVSKNSISVVIIHSLQLISLRFFNLTISPHFTASSYLWLHLKRLPVLGTFPNEDMFYVAYFIFLSHTYIVYMIQLNLKKPATEYGPAIIVQGISSQTKNEESKQFLNVDNNNCSILVIYSIVEKLHVITCTWLCREGFLFLPCNN